MTEAAIVVGVGANEGVGAAAVRRFAREGLTTFAVGRTPERLEAVASDVRANGGNCHALPADATSPEDCQRVFDTVEEQTGAPPRLVLYNAGNNFPKPLLEMTDDDFEGSWRVCAFGGFLYAREAARRMVPAGGGTVIFTGATASLRSRPPFVAFAAAKAAERAVAHGLAREFGPQGLHVAHVVVDGVIFGDQVKSRFPDFIASREEDHFLNVDAIADAMWTLHCQDKTAWTLELDLRPYAENF